MTFIRAKGLAAE